MAGKFVSPKAKESLMTDILVKLFVKDYKDVEKVSVRTAYGVLASGVGIFCNVLLTIAKMVMESFFTVCLLLQMHLTTYRMRVLRSLE